MILRNLWRCSQFTSSRQVGDALYSACSEIESEFQLKFYVSQIIWQLYPIKKSRMIIWSSLVYYDFILLNFIRPNICVIIINNLIINKHILIRFISINIAYIYNKIFFIPYYCIPSLRKFKEILFNSVFSDFTYSLLTNKTSLFTSFNVSVMIPIFENYVRLENY